MTAMPHAAAAAGPGVLDALSLAVRGGRRARRLAPSATPTSPSRPRPRVLDRRARAGDRRSPAAGLHRGDRSGVYAGLGAGLRGPSGAGRGGRRGLDRGSAAGWTSTAAGGSSAPRSTASSGTGSPRSVRGGRSRWRPGWAVATWSSTATACAAAYPRATGRLVVFLHGLCEDESSGDRRRDDARDDVRRGPRRPGLDPGHAAHQHRAHAARQRRRPDRAAPAPHPGVAGARRAHRAGRALDGRPGVPGGRGRRGRGRRGGRWADQVSDVVTLGTPHLGCPARGGVGRGSRALARLPESAAFGRILDLALGRRPRPRARPGPRRAAAAARALPAGAGHAHPLASAPAGVIAGRLPGRASRRRTAAAAPCRALPGRGALHVPRARPLPPAQPPAACTTRCTAGWPEPATASNPLWANRGGHARGSVRPSG